MNNLTQTNMKNFKQNPWMWVAAVAVFVLVTGATVYGGTELQKGSLYRPSALRPSAPQTTTQAANPVVVGTPAQVAVAANDYPDNPSKLLPNTIVQMYVVTPVGPGQYSGRAVAAGVTQANGAGVMFTVQPGDLVDFVTFSNAKKSAAAATWNFTSPPYKNFSASDGNSSRLCQIDMLDTTKKLKMQNGQDSCGESFSYPVSDKKGFDPSAVRAFQRNP